MYRFSINKKNLGIIKKIGINAYSENQHDLLGDKESKEFSGKCLFNLEMVTKELDFINSSPQEHRYISSLNLLNKLYISNIDHGEIRNTFTKVMHFEKGCFKLLDCEIKGILFFVQDGWYHSQINIKDGSGEHWISQQSEFIRKQYSGIESVRVKPNSKHLYKSHTDTIIAHVCAKICLSAIVLESLGLTNVKEGLWRNRISKKARVNLLEYIEPSSSKTVTWHFRQLRNERFYRGEHKGKEHGSRWIFICPENGNVRMSTLLN